MSAILHLWTPPEVGRLRGLSDALVAAEDVEAAASRTAEWVGTVVPDADVWLWQPDHDGTLRIVWPAGVDAVAPPDHDLERRSVFESMRSSSVRPPDRADHLHAMFPLDRHGEPIGVLEVVAPDLRLESAWEALEIAADQLSLTLHALALQERLQERLRDAPGPSFDTPAPDAHRDDRGDELDLSIAWTAHELRGPLVALKAALEVLGEQGRSSPHTALIDRCRVEVDRLSTLVRETLRWGVTGDPPLRRECDLVEVVEDSIEQCRLELGVDRVTLHAPPSVTTRIDPVQVRAAIANLVRNALLYSAPDSAVDVLVNLDGAAISITVRNAGDHIPETDRPEIFLPFVRGANADGRSGKGLGLFIARRIAEANGGRVTLASADGATEFRFEIPRGSEA